MTKIVFFRSGGTYYGFEEQGHAGYGEAGDDVVCAAISAMTMLVINTIEVAYASDVDYSIDEGATHIMVRSKAALPEFEEAILEAQDYYISKGFTTIQDGTPTRAGRLSCFERLADAGLPRPR